MKSGSGGSKLMRIMGSPIRALGKARDMYVRSITNCGQHMNYYGDPMEGAGRFARSHSVAASSVRSEVSDEDYAELVRVASARTTLENRIRVSKVLPKSSSVGMVRIDEDKAVESDGGAAFAADLYPRSRSYAVAKSKPAFETVVKVQARK